MSAGLNVLKNTLKDLTAVDVDQGQIGNQAANEALRRLESRLIINGSITKLASTLVVNPEIVATTSATRSSAFDDAASVVVDVFSGFYLQAFQILTNLYGFSGIEAIAILKENSGGGTDKVKAAAMKRVLDNTIKETEKVLNKESFKGLFNLDFNTLHLDHEALTPDEIEIEKAKLNLKNKELDLKNKEIDAKMQADMAKFQAGRTGAAGALAEVDDRPEKLSTLVKHLNVTLDIGKTIMDGASSIDGGTPAMIAKREKGIHISKLYIPITVMTGINRVQLGEVLDIVVDKSYKRSFSNRWMEYKSGGITLSDLIFCTDLIKDYKKKHIKKADDLSNRLEGKAVSKVLSTLVERNPHGAETSYNMIIITKDELATIEKAVNGKITNGSTKDKILASLMAHSLTVLDDEVERLTVYVSDISGSLDIGYKKLNKTKNTDLTDIMKYMMIGKMPEL